MAFFGCETRDLRPLNPCTVSGVQIKVPFDNLDKVDLLFVIDDSQSMRDEQNALRAEIPRLVRTLVTGQRDGDEPFPPVRNLRVGIVSTDMGVGSNSVSSCEVPGGDDGRLLRGAGDCTIGTSMPPFLEFRSGEGDDPDVFSDRVQCMAELGITGCGLEQQLESMLKAVTPSTSGVRFENGSVGHADIANQGFVRDDSLLAVIMLTDEDDCSAANTDLFNRASPTFTDPDFNLRCWRYGDPSFGALHPVQRYVDGLLALRPPERLMFAAITGVPLHLVPEPGESPDYSRLVGPDGMRDPAMVEQPNPDTSVPGLAPSCQVPDSGVAFPPVRIVRVAQSLEAARVSTVLQSICNSDFSGALTRIIDRLAELLSATCLPRPLNQDSDGRVTCNVVEALPLRDSAPSCADLETQGRVHDGFDEMGREVCHVCQGNASGTVIDTRAECIALGTAGWFYETGDSLEQCPTDRRQRVSFRSGAEPISGAVINVECLQQSNSVEGDVTIGTGCGADPSVCADGEINGEPVALTCTLTDRVCALPCANTSDCTAAGLGGYACYAPLEGEPAICVNPTCTE